MIEFGPFRYDAGSRVLYRDEREIMLPPRVLAVLESLLKRPGEVVGKDAMLESAWDGAFVGEDSLTQAISQLRSALGDDAQRPRYVQTIPKRGYRFIAEVSQPLSDRGPVPEPADNAPEVPVPEASPASPPAETPAEDPPSSSPHALLAIGSRIGNYELRGRIGSGAMGEVWRARDTELRREVAVKAVPQQLAGEAVVLERFRREARMLAAVNHPNIATIHGIEEVDGERFIVMELLAGQTLQQRLEAGALPVDDALDVAVQVARALEVAHDAGIVHRDLKPANIMLDTGNSVKVLDFGLAKESESRDDAATVDPTLLSADGLQIGTAAYMSPEQAAGKPIDKRSDIFSFGCVLFEMLAGERPFGGEGAAETVAAILKDDPSWERLPETLPYDLRALLRRCLRKDPDRRTHDIADARIEIEEASDGAVAPPVVDLSRRRSIRSPWMAAVALAALALGVLSGRTIFGPETSPEPPTSLTVVLGDGQRLSGGNSNERAGFGLQRPTRTAIALSPDGRQLVYAADGPDGYRLYLRDLGRTAPVPIAGTEDGCCPFFSPDGSWIGFHADRALKKVPLEGGPAITLANTLPPPHAAALPGIPRPYGASWGDGGTIVFAGWNLGGLSAVSQDAGPVRVLTSADPDDGEFSHRLPHVLPGGNALLFTVRTARHLAGGSRDAHIALRLLDGSGSRILIEDGVDARYAPTGHIVFARRGALWAVGFDLDRLQIVGAPVRILEDVMHTAFTSNESMDTNAAQFTFSQDGTLAYAAGGVYPELQGSLAWVDRAGNPELFDGPAGDYIHPRISPDGRHLAYSKGRDGDRDIWIYDIERGTERPLTAEDTNVMAPVWSPEGDRIVFTKVRDGKIGNLYWRAADGSGDLVPLVIDDDHEQQASSWEAGTLAFVQDDEDIWVLSMGEEGAQPEPFLTTAAVERAPALSPDGKWMAYSSTEGETRRVWVRPYPDYDPPSLVSDGSGRGPTWSRDGSQLYYRTGGRMMVVDVTYQPTIRFSSPRLLFEHRYDSTDPVRSYDPLPGSPASSMCPCFVMLPQIDQEPSPATEITVVLNWFDELKRLVPTGR